MRGEVSKRLCLLTCRFYLLLACFTYLSLLPEVDNKMCCIRAPALDVFPSFLIFGAPGSLPPPWIRPWLSKHKLWVQSASLSGFEDHMWCFLNAQQLVICREKES